MDGEKKTAHALEQDRPDILKRRRDWFDGQLDLDPAKLVFIDETGLSTKMARLRGRAPIGERFYSTAPFGKWRTQTFIAGLTQNALIAPCVIAGAMNGPAFDTYIETQLAPALDRLAHSLRALSAAHTGTVKMGRTHLMDAVPMTFGQEVGGWARSVELGRDRITSCLDRLLELPLGGTAVGTGLNAPPGFDADIATELARRTGLATRPAADHMEAQSRTDSLTELSAMVKVVSLSLYAIAGDLRLLGSGPVGGLAEIRLPSLQAGSSIMPGKVNPVIPEAVQQVAAQIVGNDATVTFAATMSNLQLNTAAPVIARALVSSLQLLANAARLLADRCITGIAVDADRMLDVARRSPALVTVLAPSLGYDAAAALVSRAREDGRPLAELARDAGVPEHVTARLDDLAGMTRPSPDVSRSTGSGTGAP